MSKMQFSRTKDNLMNAAIIEKQLQEQYDPHYQQINERTRHLNHEELVTKVPYLQSFTPMKEDYKHVPSIVPQRRRH